MQREIASVMAACAMRGIRYIAFPPVIFAAPEDQPASVVEVTAEMEAMPAMTPPTAVSEPVIAAFVTAPAAMPPPAMPEPAAPLIATPTIATPAMPPPASPGPAMRRLAELASGAPDPPARLRPLAELSAAESLASPEAGAPRRRYALLNDIAVELRPRQTRPRAGKRAWP